MSYTTRPSSSSLLPPREPPRACARGYTHLPQRERELRAQSTEPLRAAAGHTQSSKARHAGPEKAALRPVRASALSRFDSQCSFCSCSRRRSVRRPMYAALRRVSSLYMMAQSKPAETTQGVRRRTLLEERVINEDFEFEEGSTAPDEGTDQLWLRRSRGSAGAARTA
jgi:hypothetical protein